VDQHGMPPVVSQHAASVRHSRQQCAQQPRTRLACSSPRRTTPPARARSHLFGVELLSPCSCPALRPV